MNKHLNDLTEVAAKVINQSSRAIPTSTEHKVVTVPLALILKLREVLQSTPLAEVDESVIKAVGHAVSRGF